MTFLVDIDSYTFSFIVLLFAEFLLLIPLHRDESGWKWRWSNTIISTWKPAVYYFIIFFVGFILNPIFEEQIKNVLTSFSFAYLLAPSTALIGFIWIWNIVIGKSINRLMVLLLVIAIILIGIFIMLNFDHISIIFNETLGVKNDS